MESTKRKAELDPDYENIPEIAFKRIRLKDEEVTKKNYERIIKLFQQEFQKEISSKREEIHKIQQRLLKAQKTFHLLKYVVVKSFYERKDLKLANTEVSVTQTCGSSFSTPNETLLNSQNRIHPAVKKLIGKKPLNYEPHRTRKKFNATGSNENLLKTKIDNEFECKNEEEKLFSPNLLHADSSCSLENTDVVSNEKEYATKLSRNHQKTKHRIIIGNISKWTPSDSAQDKSTHKWMVYVRGPKDNPDITHIVKKVRFFLHPSYQPNDIIEVQEAPFHLSRRGWGEFPLRVQIHFEYSSNKPVDIIHNIKLDRTYTGRQTMGNETIVDLWLYEENVNDDAIKNNKSLPTSDKLNSHEETKENKLRTNKHLKCEDNLNYCTSTNNYIPNDEIINVNHKSPDVVKQLSGLKPLVFKNDILTKTRKLILLSNPLKPQVSLLKRITIRNVSDINDSVTASVKAEEPNIEDEYIIRNPEHSHLEDHCYAKPAQAINDQSINAVEINKFNPSDVNYTFDKEKYKITIPVEKFSSVYQIVHFLFKSLPIITTMTNILDYECVHPYAANSLEQFYSWNTARQFCAEWYQAKHIKTILSTYSIDHKEWTTKIILMYGRAHGFMPPGRFDLFKKTEGSEKTVPDRFEVPEYVNTYTEIKPIKELIEFRKSNKKQNDDCNIDVVNIEPELPKVKRKEEVKYAYPSHEMAELDDLSLPCSYIKQTAEKIGINLGPEEIVPGIWHNTAQRIIFKALCCFTEEVIRKALSNSVIKNGNRNSEYPIEANEIFNVLLQRPEFDVFLNVGLGKDVSL